MKKVLLVILGLAVAGIIFLSVRGRDVQEIRTEIEISAPPSKVWSIITDIDKWQEWSPIINASQGQAVLGEELSITMVSEQVGENGPKYSPVIIDLKEHEYFHWRAHMLAGFVFTNDKIFKLEETGAGTHLVHIETFRGLIAPLMAGSVEENVPAMLDSMNAAMKALAENQ